jgi:uncharacterized iron-regulated membrane protein
LRLTTLGIQAHSGTLLGLVNEIAMAALALGILVLVGCGYGMWWRRRSGATRSVPGPTLLQLPPRVIAAVVVVTVVAAWAMPVFGVTLAGFLVVDVLMNRRARTRARPGADAV